MTISNDDLAFIAKAIAKANKHPNPDGYVDDVIFNSVDHMPPVPEETVVVESPLEHSSPE